MRSAAILPLKNGEILAWKRRFCALMYMPMKQAFLWDEWDELDEWDEWDCEINAMSHPSHLSQMSHYAIFQQTCRLRRHLRKNAPPPRLASRSPARPSRSMAGNDTPRGRGTQQMKARKQPL